MSDNNRRCGIEVHVDVTLPSGYRSLAVWRSVRKHRFSDDALSDEEFAQREIDELAWEADDRGEAVEFGKWRILRKGDPVADKMMSGIGEKRKVPRPSVDVPRPRVEERTNGEAGTHN